MRESQEFMTYLSRPCYLGSSSLNQTHQFLRHLVDLQVHLPFQLFSEFRQDIGYLFPSYWCTNLILCFPLSTSSADIYVCSLQDRYCIYQFQKTLFAILIVISITLAGMLVYFYAS